jgi:hypothetical protein
MTPQASKGVRAGWAASVLLLAALTLACGSGRPAYVGRTLPHPGGCFVEVWDQPRFVGASDFINGPRRYETLRSMPGSRDWSDRIRSVKLGPTASLTAWSEEHFRGKAITLSRDSRIPEIGMPTAPQIRSLAIGCDLEAAD